MRVAAVLALYAVLLAVLPSRVLARAASPSRCPRAGIVVWQVPGASALRPRLASAWPWLYRRCDEAATPALS